jgi:hypothetical protein
VSSGQAIASIRNNDPDPRLPYIDSKSFRSSPERGLFNGWPGDFPNIPKIWTPPQKSSLSNQTSQSGETSPQYTNNAVPKLGGSGILSGGGWGGILTDVFPQ